MATQSQLDVCGAPTRMPDAGACPTVFQRANRSTRRANALRSTGFRRVGGRVLLDEVLHDAAAHLAAQLYRAGLRAPVRDAEMLALREGAVGGVPGGDDELRRRGLVLRPGAGAEVLERRELGTLDRLVVPNDRVAVLEVVHELFHLGSILDRVERTGAEHGGRPVRPVGRRHGLVLLHRAIGDVGAQRLGVRAADRLRGAAARGRGGHTKGGERLVGRVVSLVEIGGHDRDGNQRETDNHGEHHDQQALTPFLGQLLRAHGLDAGTTVLLSNLAALRLVGHGSLSLDIR